MHWRLFADLANVAGDRRVEIEDEAETVREALDGLLESHPELESRIMSDAGGLESHINVLLNGETVSEDLQTTVRPDDELALFPPVSGG